MKKIISTCIALMVSAACSISAFAMEVPTNTTIQDLNGVRQYIKIYTVAPDTDPQSLIDDVFEYDGYTYTYSSMTKEEQSYSEKEHHTETVTADTEKSDLSVVLKALSPSIEYDDGEFQGTLYLDHSTISTVASGYTTKSYTVSATKEIDNLDTNDMAYVPDTTTKNGVTVQLQSVDWQVQGTSLVDDILMPAQYKAVATYAGRASYRYGAQAHLHRTKNERVLDQLTEIAKNPDAFYPIRGAHRRFPLSTYIKKKLRGRIDGFLCDELHEYNNNSGQGDAMAELYGASRCFVGMTATLINGYSSGIFHLLYRIVPGLMLKDGKRYKSPGDFDAEYGVVENTYEIQDAEYNSNRRTSKRRTKSKQLPGVSPLVFSRFLLEYTAFLSLSDMGKDLPDYEEIPVPLEMPEDVRTAYKEAEHELQKVLRTDRKAAQKILSTYLNLLTVYPDQPYDQPEVVHPINGMPIVTPKNCGDFSRLLPKEERVLELVRQKAANGERVLIYTSWTRTDSQKKLQKLLCSEGYRTEILTPQIATDKREDWVNKRVPCSSAGQKIRDA